MKKKKKKKQILVMCGFHFIFKVSHKAVKVSHRKTPVLKPLFKKVAALLKRDFNTGAFL